MGGLDWAALPIVAAMLGIEEPELFVARLTTIRDWQAENRS